MINETKTPETPKSQPAAENKKPTSPPAKQTKTDMVLGMLREKDGTTIAKLAEVTGWQTHTVRGTLANLKKKRSLPITSERVGDERRYFIKEALQEAANA